jgi:hypothetical protein
MDFGVSREELLNSLGLVSREVGRFYLSANIPAAVGLELGGIGGYETFEPIGLNRVASLHPRHHRMA